MDETIPRRSMYAIYAYIGVVWGVNVDIYSIHGVYGKFQERSRSGDGRWSETNDLEMTCHIYRILVNKISSKKHQKHTHIQQEKIGPVALCLPRKANPVRRKAAAVDPNPPRMAEE